MGTVEVRRESFRRAVSMLRTLRHEIGRWGRCGDDAKQKLYQECEGIRTALEPLGAMLPVFLFEVRHIKLSLALLEKLSSAVHSTPHVETTDRRKALGMIRTVCNDLQSYVQISLF